MTFSKAIDICHYTSYEVQMFNYQIAETNIWVIQKLTRIFLVEILICLGMNASRLSQLVGNNFGNRMALRNIWSYMTGNLTRSDLNKWDIFLTYQKMCNCYFISVGQWQSVAACLWFPLAASHAYHIMGPIVCFNSRHFISIKSRDNEKGWRATQALRAKGSLDISPKYFHLLFKKLD